MSKIQSVVKSFKNLKLLVANANFLNFITKLSIDDFYHTTKNNHISNN